MSYCVIVTRRTVIPGWPCFFSTIWRGYRRALEYTDLWNMNPEDRAGYVGAKFEKEWQKEVKRAK